MIRSIYFIATFVIIYSLPWLASAALITFGFIYYKKYPEGVLLALVIDLLYSPGIWWFTVAAISTYFIGNNIREQLL